MLAGDFTAGERMAAFPVILSRCYAARGLSPKRFRLNLARTGIANDLPKLEAMAANVLRP